MSYKIKNGFVFINYNGSWWLDEVLFAIYPDLKNTKLTAV